jgi:hypothetical protein
MVQGRLTPQKSNEKFMYLLGVEVGRRIYENASEKDRIKLFEAGLKWIEENTNEEERRQALHWLSDREDIEG